MKRKVLIGHGMPHSHIHTLSRLLFKVDDKEDDQ